MAYLVPEECGYKKHFSRFQDTILAFCSGKIGKQFQVGCITVDSALHSFPVRPERVGIKIGEIDTKQSNLLPVNTILVAVKYLNDRNVDKNETISH